MAVALQEQQQQEEDMEDSEGDMARKIDLSKISVLSNQIRIYALIELFLYIWILNSGYDAP